MFPQARNVPRIPAKTSPCPPHLLNPPGDEHSKARKKNFKNKLGSWSNYEFDLLISPLLIKSEGPFLTTLTLRLFIFSFMSIRIEVDLLNETYYLHNSSREACFESKFVF